MLLFFAVTDGMNFANNNKKLDRRSHRKLGACGLHSDASRRSDRGKRRTGGCTAATPASQLRDLTPQEKKIIVDAIVPSLKEPEAAKYKWTKFPMVPPSDEVSYCATVDAKSPYAAYSGHQSYIVDTKVTGGHITAAVLGLIAGGKDAAIVAGMCEKHGLDPNSAT